MSSTKHMRLSPGAARQGSLREHNLALVLTEIMSAASAPSRADIAATTGLTRATVSALVETLAAARLITELTPSRSRRAGRPAVPLIPAVGTVAAIGLEVNVDYLGIIALDLAGHTLTHHLIEGDFRRSDPEVVLARLAELTSIVIQHLQARQIGVLGLCLALPGLVDQTRGTLQQAPNLGWRDVDIKAIFAAALDLTTLPLSLENEANLAAVTEANLLSSSECHSFLYVSGEVGIGAAIIFNSRLNTGQHGWSGELGHTAVERNGRRCSCGATGCLEQYAGQDALMQASGLDLQQPIQSLIDAADADEPEALAALREAGQALGVALSNFVNLVDISTVVLGGIYAQLATWLIPSVQEQLSQRVLSASWASPQVLISGSDRRASMIGGALTIIDSLTDNPAPWTVTHPFGQFEGEAQIG